MNISRLKVELDRVYPNLNLKKTWSLKIPKTQTRKKPKNWNSIKSNSELWKILPKNDAFYPNFCQNFLSSPCKFKNSTCFELITRIHNAKNDNLPMAFGLITLFLGLIKISPPSYFLCSMASKHRFNFE